MQFMEVEPLYLKYPRYNKAEVKMEDSLLILTIRKIIVFITGLITYLLLFGYILPEYIIAGMQNRHKVVALDILTNASYIAYFLAFFTYSFLPTKIKPSATLKKILVFMLLYISFWVGYIVIA